MKLIKGMVYFQAMEPGTDKALFALGRLSEALSGSGVATAWTARDRIEAVVRLVHADGLGIDRERVLRLSYDLPVGRRPNVGSDAHVLQIIGLLGGGAEGEVRDGALGDEVREAEDAFRSGSDGVTPGTLLRSLWRWLAADRRPSVGHVAFIRGLAAAGLSPAPLGALARPSGRVRLAETPWVEESLERLADAADGARRELAALALAVAEWRQRLGPRRRHSRMDALVREVASMLVVTPTSAARRLGLSLRGASTMLEELAALGIVVEVTGRKSWKIFVPGDLVVAVPGERVQRHKEQPAAPAARSPDLEPLLVEAESAMSRVQAAMARLDPALKPPATPRREPPDEDDPEDRQPIRRS